ncbi:MAG: hypothetical protein ACP5N1_04630 [Candidatus Woesearchaeota archaeon]
MIKKLDILKILISIWLFFSLANIVLAGPVPLQDITFSFQIPENTLDNGEWQMYIISIGEFEKDSWNFTTAYDTIRYDYLNFKKYCGTDNTFYVTTYKMDDEERKHKGCVINGTYQEVYCFKTITDKNQCTNLIPYKINYKNELDFLSYYNSYMWDINRADVNNHFEPSHCNIENNSCKFTIHKSSYPYNPYIIVLEKLNSTKEIYFSDKLNIDDAHLFYNESIFPSDAVMFHVILDVELNLSKFKINDSNRLILQFENQSKVLYHQDLIEYTNVTNQQQNTTPNTESTFFERAINWVTQLFS